MSGLQNKITPLRPIHFVKDSITSSHTSEQALSCF